MVNGNQQNVLRCHNAMLTYNDNYQVLTLDSMYTPFKRVCSKWLLKTLWEMELANVPFTRISKAFH